MYVIDYKFTTKISQLAYEIKIYGEIISTYAKHQGDKGVSLEDVQAQLHAANGEDIKVRINCVGGDCQEGFAIYDELRRYAKFNKAQVHTFAESNLASVATVFFLAGDVREVSRSLEPFVHNAQWDVQGDSKAMNEAADILERWNDKIAKHYSEHTDLSYKEARQLMNSDTFITPQEATAMRFATKIEKVTRPAALQRFINPNINKMSNKKGIMAKIAAIFEGIKNKIVYDAEQREVDFYELEENEPIEVGANATIDNAPVEGSIVMESGDTYVFEGGVLKEIIEKDSEPAAEQTDDTEVEALKAKIAELEGANASLTAKLDEKTVTNKTLRTALNNVRKLESEIVDTPAEARPSNTPKATVKGSRFGKAMANYESTNKK